MQKSKLVFVLSMAFSINAALPMPYFPGLNLQLKEKAGKSCYFVRSENINDGFDEIAAKIKNADINVQNNFLIELLAAVAEVASIKTMNSTNPETLQKVAAASALLNTLKAGYSGYNLFKTRAIRNKGLISAVVDAYFAAQDAKKLNNHEALAEMNKEEKRSKRLEARKRTYLGMLAIANVLRLIDYVLLDDASSVLDINVETPEDSGLPGKTIIVASIPMQKALAGGFTFLASLIDLYAKHKRYAHEFEGLEEFKKEEKD